MEENKILAGDVVELKSGGPPMTVLFLNKSAPYGAATTVVTFRCSWFDLEGNKVLTEGDFPAVALKHKI